jgi:hypothetical protein
MITPSLRSSLLFICAQMVFNIFEWQTVAIFDCELFACFFVIKFTDAKDLPATVSKGPEAALDPKIAYLNLPSMI